MASVLADFIVDRCQQVSQLLDDLDIGKATARRAALAKAARRAACAAVVSKAAGALLLTGAAGVGAYFGVRASICAYRHVRKSFLDKAREAIDVRSGIPDALDDARDVKFDVRDCIPGEAHDFLAYDADGSVDGSGSTVDGGDVGTSASAPSTGIHKPSTRGPAVRRKKYHYRPYDGYNGLGAYTSHVVAEARLRYNGRPATATNEDAARDFMVRMMKEHGMRAVDIERELPRMTTMVFWQTQQALEQRALRAEARRIGKYGTDSVE